MGYKDVNVVVGGYNHDGTHPQTYKTVILKAGIPLGDQLTEENTIYVVKWDFEIGMNKIYSPLDFTHAGTMTIDGTTYYWSILAPEEDVIINLSDNTVFFCENGRDVLIPERSMTVVAGIGIRVASPLNTYHEKAFYTEANAVIIPENCVLKFEGGSINNGTIVGTDTHIDAENVKIFGTNIILDGTWSEDGNIRWFGASPDNSDNTVSIQKVLDSFDVVRLDNHVYRTGALKLTKCRSLLGVAKARDYTSGFDFTFNGITKSGLTVIFGDFPYVKIENVLFKIHEVSVDSEPVEGTVAIDLSASTHDGTSSGNTVPIKCSGCAFFNFAIGVKSNHKSYYNYFNDCFFTHIKDCLYDFSSNNLNVIHTYAAYFTNFINQMIGGGPANLEGNTFEVFDHAIVYSYNNTGLLNFTNNYVESIDGCITYGTVEAIVSKNNDIQIGGDFSCLYYLYLAAYNAGTEEEPNWIYYGCRSLISEGNFIYTGVFNEDGNNDYKFSYFKFTAGDNSVEMLENFSMHDIVKFARPFDPSKYIANKPYIKDYKTVIQGYDPFVKKIYACKYAGISPVVGNGYTDSDKALRVRASNSVAYFYGMIKKTDTAISEGQKKIILLPVSYLGSPNVNWSVYSYFDLHAHDSDGDPVLLRWWPLEITDEDELNPQVIHEAGSVDFIKGDTTKDIVFDGLVLNY